MSSTSHQPGDRGASGSRLLDDFLGLQDDSLSQEELDRQLRQSGRPAQPSPVAPAHPKAESPASLDEFEAMLAASSAEAANKAKIDVAIKAASHSVKMLAPMLAALSKHVDVEADPDRAGELMGAVLQRVRQDAIAVAKGCQVDADDAPAWLVSQISGHLMPIMINALERGNGVVADPSSPSAYLEPLLAMVEQAQHLAQPAFPKSPSANWELIQALSCAATEVMTEFQTFSYFHTDQAGIAQMVSDFLSERVIEQSLDPITERWGLSEAERSYMGVSLLRQAGGLLAKCWTGSIHKALENLQMMPKDKARQAMASGYPLEHVFEEFEALYQGVEVSTFSALRSLAPSRENVSQQPANHARMGN